MKHNMCKDSLVHHILQTQKTVYLSQQMFNDYIRVPDKICDSLKVCDNSLFIIQILCNTIFQVYMIHTKFLKSTHLQRISCYYTDRFVTTVLFSGNRTELITF
jgi:hypothetical protein